MRVHARPVVTEERLRHERRALARVPRDVLDDVLELHHVVARLEHRVEAVVDLLLAGRPHLVVAALDLQAHVRELQAHLVTDVGEVVHRRHGEVPALERGLVPAVAALLLATGVPRRLLGVDLVEALAGGDRVAHVVEDVELGLGGEERRVRDAGRSEVLLRLLGDLTRVLAVDLTGARVVDVEHHDQRLRGAERVDVGGCDVGDELHVRLVDAREAADRRAVEELSVTEEVVVDRGGGDVEVLLDPGKVGESDVEELDVVLLDVADDLGGLCEHVRLLIGYRLHQPYAGYASGVSQPCPLCFRRVTAAR